MIETWIEKIQQLEINTMAMNTRKGMLKQEIEQIDDYIKENEYEIEYYEQLIEYGDNK